MSRSRLHGLLTLILGNHVYKAIAHCSPHLSQAWCLITRPLRTSCVSHDLVYLFPKSWIATTKLPRSQDRAFGIISSHGRTQMTVFNIGCKWLKASRLYMLAIDNNAPLAYLRQGGSMQVSRVLSHPFYIRVCKPTETSLAH